MVSAFAVSYIGSFQVTRLFAVVPWSGLRIRHTLFLMGDGGNLNVMVYQVKIQNMDHLKEGIREASAGIIPDVLQRVRHELERHIYMCYLCNGVHVQHMCK